MAKDVSQAVSLPIDTMPDAKRQAELEAAYQQNIAQGNAPYDRASGIRIATYGELLWIFQQRQWSGMISLPEGSQRPNLSMADLRDATLSGAELLNANLSGANLRFANLNRVHLVRADLSGADLEHATLTRAHLYYANLSGAHLEGADLNGADLEQVNLNGTDLLHTNLSGASLAGAKCDSDTNLAEIILSSTTILRDIRWNGVSLMQLNWAPIQHLGENDKQHPDYMARTYRQLATQLRSQGMNEIADRFAYLAQVWHRHVICQHLRRGNLRYIGSYLGSLLLWAISGYGYRPSRTFVAYLLTVGSFAAAYYAVTHTVETQLAKLSWDEALVLSLTSFHGRGFLPGFLALGDWVARIGALEAVIGLFIELILIATFSRRFLGN